MKNCFTCGGAVFEPNQVVGYSGPVCHCYVPPRIQRLSNDSSKPAPTEVHTCYEGHCKPTGDVRANCTICSESLSPDEARIHKCEPAGEALEWCIDVNGKAYPQFKTPMKEALPKEWQTVRVIEKSAYDELRKFKDENILLLSQANRECGAEIEKLRAELAATIKAKQENDERFMIERDEALKEVERLKGALKQIATNAHKIKWTEAAEIARKALGGDDV
jgi:hypothetical protein